MLNLNEAFDIVLDLARQNVIEESADNEEEHRRQTESIDMIEEFKDNLMKNYPHLMNKD